MQKRITTPKLFLIIKIIVFVLLTVIVVCLIGIYVQNQKIKSLKQENSSLQNQIYSFNQKVQSIDVVTRKYLSMQGEKCDQDIDSCFESIITRLLTKPILPSASGGLCVIRDQSTSMPSYLDPNVGKGYAKIVKENINTLWGLKQSCSEDDYAKLMQSYCAQNTNPVQFGVATVNKFGGIISSSCSALGCAYIDCPNK